MKSFVRKVKQFMVSEDGPTAVEYAVMLALIIIVCLVAIGNIGTNANATFSKVAGQSTHFMASESPPLKKLIADSDKRPLTMYIDWGRYDIVYGPGLSWRTLNQEFAGFLKENGYNFAGGEVNSAFNWACWRNRTDKILETFFPLTN